MEFKQKRKSSPKGPIETGVNHGSSLKCKKKYTFKFNKLESDLEHDSECSLYSNLENKSILSDPNLFYKKNIVDDAINKIKNNNTHASFPKHKKYKRIKKQCPILNCKSIVANIPRHLRSIHKIDLKLSKQALYEHDMRKKYTWQNDAKYKNIIYKCRNRKVCPVEDCKFNVISISRHMKLKHKLNNKQYKELCKIKNFNFDKSNESFEKTSLKYNKLNESVDKTILNFEELNESVDETLYNFDELNESNVKTIVNFDELNESVDKTIVNECHIINNMKLPNKVYFINEMLKKNFKNWLVSFDGGCKPLKSADQHAYQIGIIIDLLKMPLSIEEFCNAKNIREEFLDNYCIKKEFAPSTIKCYLNSLSHLTNYLLSCKEYCNHNKILKILQSQIKIWINSLKKKCDKFNLYNYDKQINKLISSDDIQKFECSAISRNCINILETCASETFTISKDTFCHVRDFLIVHLCFNNAHRSGVYSNMLIEDFLQAKKKFEDEEEFMIVSVSNHKTAALYGPAKVILKMHIYIWIKIYIEKLVLRLSSLTKYVFPSFNGQQLQSGHISQAIQSIWKQASLNSEINCTLIRKTAVSKIHKNAPTEKDNLADLMLHRTATATISYRKINRENVALKASCTLSKIMRGQDEKVNFSNTESISECHAPQLSAIQEDKKNEIIYDTVSSSSFRIFSPEDVSILLTRCHDMIENGVIGSLRLKKSLEHPDSNYLLNNFTTEQLITRIKYERRKRRQFIKLNF